jgi:acyl carrier protein
MTHRAIADTLKTLISEQLGISEDEITRDALLQEDLGADSLDAVEIVMGAEDAFHVQVDDDTADAIRTFGHLFDATVAAIKAKRGAA